MSLSTLGPLVLVWLVGVALAIVRWNQHKKVSTWLLVGLSIIFIGTVAGRIFGLSLPSLARSWGWPISTVGRISWLVYFALSLFTSCGWGCVVAAVFIQRGPAPSQR